MDVDDDEVSLSPEQKAKNLKTLRKLIEDMEGLDEETEEFTDQWFADGVEFFRDIRSKFPDFLLVKNPENLKNVEEAKITAEENASHLEYEMDTGGSFDIPAFWRFCIAVENMVQSLLKLDEHDSDMEFVDTFNQLTIPTL